jgi:hypothetical protein
MNRQRIIAFTIAILFSVSAFGKSWSIGEWITNGISAVPDLRLADVEYAAWGFYKGAQWEEISKALPLGARANVSPLCLLVITRTELLFIHHTTNNDSELDSPATYRLLLRQPLGRSDQFEAIKSGKRLRLKYNGEKPFEFIMPEWGYGKGGFNSTNYSTNADAVIADLAAILHRPRTAAQDMRPDGSSSAVDGDIESRIKILNELREKKLISEEEYTKKRAELLQQL